MLVAVNFHYVRPAFAAHGRGVQGVTLADLQAQLELLASVGELVSADQVRRAVAGEASLPPRAVLVTFDDGLREQFEFALPVLDRVGAPAIFFANTAPIEDGTVCAVHKLHLLLTQLEPADLSALLATAAAAHDVSLARGDFGDAPAAQYRYDVPDVARLKYLLNLVLAPADRDRLIAACFDEVFGDERCVSTELYMTPAHLRALADRDYLGSHGHAHQPVGLLTADAMEHDVAASLAGLERWTGRRPYAFSFPYGSEGACASAARDVVARHGIAFALTMERAGNPDLRHPLHLARFSCSDLPGGKDARYPLATLFDAVPAAAWYRS